MATSTLNPVIDHLRRAVLLRDGAGLTDGQLLESFVSQKDESAFEVLVRRHGPMVLGVCRRVLRNHHDAEEAFQATFLVLVRKADSIVPREMFANWLYGVAYRTALKARSMIAKQRVRERQVMEAPEPEAIEPDHCWRELQPLLDQELSRLPDKYRVPIVLCDLQGKTGKDAARQLGWPEGTVASRLSRGRVMLATRLTRHGLALSGGPLAAVLSQNAASASVPTSLVSSTVKGALLLAGGEIVTAGLASAKVAALTEGVLEAMFVNKLKITLVLLAVIGVVGTGLGGVCYRVAAKDQPAVPSGQHQVAQVQPAQDKAKEKEKKAPEEPRPPDQDQAKQVLDMVLKGFQAYQDSKGKQGGPPNKEAMDLYSEAFLKAFQISSEMAKAKGKKALDDRASPDQEQAKQVLELMRKGLEAYTASKSKQGERADKNALDQYAEAFLKAFQLSSEIAKAKAKGPAQKTAEDQQALDAFGAAFVQAYDRAKTLKKALEEQQAADGKGSARALEALDVFLKAGKEFEQAVKQRAKTKAVQQARREIENALSQVKKATHDRRTEQEALEEIEKAVQELKKKLQENTPTTRPL